MKKLVLLLVFFLSAIIYSQYQSPWYQEYPYLDLSHMSSFFYSEQLGWTCIYLDSRNSDYDLIILKTYDGGNNWEQIYTFPANYKLFGKIQFVNETTGFISVGTEDDSHVYKTTNGGYSWEKILPDQFGNSRKFYFINENVGFVHVLNSTESKLVVTTNSGISWSIKIGFSTAASTVSDFSFYNNYGWIIVSYEWYDEFYKTTNLGVTWTSIYPNFGFRISKLKFFNELEGYVFGRHSQIIKTNNGGYTWENFYYNWNITSFDAYQADGPDSLYIVGMVGYYASHPSLIQTKDGGSNWSIESFNNISQFNSISKFNSGRVYISAVDLNNSGGSAQLIIDESNSNQKLLGLGAKHDLIGIFSTNEERIAIGYTFKQSTLQYESIVLKGAPNWTIKGTWPRKKFTTSYFKNKNEGFIGYTDSSESGILFTSDFCDNIVEVYNENGIVINSINFIDSLNGYAIGNSGLFIMTTDGGLTWTRKTSFTKDNLNCVTIDSSIIYICSDSGNLFISTNGGNNWISRNIGKNVKLNGIAVNNNNGIFVVGELGSIFVSNDFGESWSNNSTSTNYQFNYVKFYSDYVGRILGGTYDDSSSVILETHNSGLTWDEYTSTLSKTLNNSCYIFPFKQWVVGNSGTILFNNYLYTPPLPVELLSFSASSQASKVILNWHTASELNNQGFEIQRNLENSFWITIGFKQGQGTTTESTSYDYVDDISGMNSNLIQYRLKQVDFNGEYKYSDIVEVLIAPSEFSLNQNFPNPFNPTTTISYQLPKTANVTIKVFDILGREVATLVNEEKPAGNYEIKFDGAQYSRPAISSGIYFYQLKAGDFVETKKMILLK